MQITSEQVQLIAYRLIRIASRSFDNEMSAEDLGYYVRGVVDLQSELYEKGNLQSELCKKGNIDADSD